MGFLKNEKRKMNFKNFKNPIDKMKNQCYNTYIVIKQQQIKKERKRELIMANTTTKKEYFAMVAEIVNASQHARKADILKFVAREVELLDKKHSKNADKKSASTVDTKAAIIEVLTENGKPMTISEMLQDERLATFGEGENKQVMSNQRLSAIVKQLVDKGTVTRTEEKKKAYFSC